MPVVLARKQRTSLDGGHLNRLILLATPDGYGDREIAALFGVCPSAVRWRRKRLGVKGNGWVSPTNRARMLAGVRKSLHRNCVSSLVEYRWQRERAALLRAGIPMELNRREGEILLLLLVGPMIRHELAIAIGLPDGRAALVANVPGGSYTAHLRRLGLVSESRQRCGRIQAASLYKLTAEGRAAAGRIKARERTDVPYNCRGRIVLVNYEHGTN